jgi:aromatic amino acid transport protein
MSFSKILGCIMLVMGTSIGGGILALPMVGIGSGLIPTFGLIIFLWALIALSGLLFLELTLSFPAGENNFTSIAYKTLGHSGRIMTFISYLLLLYALVAAYIAGGGSLLSEIFRLMNIHISPSVSGLIFVIVLGSFVIHGVKAVDYVNRTFFSIKALFLILTLLFLTPYIDLSNTLIHESHFRYIWAAAPIYLCAFGYHILIPTLTNYLNRQQKTIRFVILLGTFLTMLIYLIWLFEILGIVSIENFAAFLKNQGSTGEFIAMIMGIVQNKWVNAAINGFANITITTSFLGVSLALYDFLADALKRPKTLRGKAEISLLCFLPPTLFAIFYPQGFVLALGYAAICVAFSLIMLPALMVWQLRKKKMGSSYRVFGGSTLLFLVFFIGLALIILQILDRWHWWPTFNP